ncbi:MAG TPA: hypothetical protein VG675_20870 [Bryobacteraceae bacterium]|nr:hypothetical protein [Bryobacteraceae bacterium]
MNTGHLEKLVEKVRSLPDSEARQAALELVQAVMDLHAAGLDRMMDILSTSESGRSLLEEFADDPAASGILLLHDLHPFDLETRVLRAIAEPSFRARGAHVELVSIREGTVHVRVEGGPALEAAVRRAIGEAAPDAAEIVVESSDTRVSGGFVPLAELRAG